MLFGDSTKCSRLVYWGVVTAIDVGDSDTHYTVFPVRPLAPVRRTQDLVLVSSGEPIAEGYIRPYAICRTPNFLSGNGSAVSRPAPRRGSFKRRG